MLSKWPENQGLGMKTIPCPECGMPSTYSAYGHIYEARCTFCGYEEGGTFFPAHREMPRSPEVHVLIKIDGAQPTAVNLMWLRQLHPKFARLSPAELKAVFVAEPLLNIDHLNGEDIARLKVRCERLGFQVVVEEIPN